MSDWRVLCCIFSPFDRSPIVKPVRAFPTGKPIKPRTPLLPIGPYITPGSIPAMSPVIKPVIGPP